MTVSEHHMTGRVVIVLSMLALLAATLAWLPARAQGAGLVKPLKAQVGVQSTFNDSKITACDIDGDGVEEILAGNTNGYMYCFHPDGAVQWAKHCGAAIRGGAACWDVDGDGKKEVFWGDMNGVVWGVACNGWNLSQWGWPKQTANTGGFVGVYGAPAIGDINGDGAADIVVGSWGHYVYAWSYTGGSLPGWPFDTKDTIWSSPALADINRDGLKEVVIGGDCTGGSGWPYPSGGLLWVLKGNGTVQPGFPQCTPEVLWSSPACADIDNDGFYEIVIGTGHYYTATGHLSTQGYRLYAYNHDGSMVGGYPVNTPGCTMTSPAIADIDGDGIKEIAIASYPVNGGSNSLMLIKGNNGSPMWSTGTFGGPDRGSPVFADINSDGRPEVIEGSGQAIGAWDLWGNCVWNQVLDNFVLTTPAVGDFDNNGRVECAVGTGADSGGGSFFIFDCGTKRTGNANALFPWPHFHRTIDLTGAIPTGNEPPPPPPSANFHEYILMMNPGGRKANVTIQFMSEKGEKTIVKRTVEPRSRGTLWVNSVLSGVGISAKVTSDVPIICERPMYFNYKGAWTGGHDVMGALSPEPRFYFAEGSCRPGFDAYLCIQNPQAYDSAIRITYMRGDGTTREQSLTVGKKSRSTVRVKDVLGEGDSAAFDFSCKVETTNGQDIICERPMYFNYGGNWTGGHDVMGALDPSGSWYFAEGTCRPNFEPYLCIQNPGLAASSVKITYMRGNGKTMVQTLTVGRRSRSTVRVKGVLGEGDTPAYDFSCKVETTNDQNIIVERPMYFSYGGNWTGGHDVMGALAPSGTFYFAEGTCRLNFESYLCLQNPGRSVAAVRITYMKANGANQVQNLDVPGNSRKTVRVKDVMGQGNDPSFDFSCRVETTNKTTIIAERPMYFDYNGWTGGHDAVGVYGPSQTWYFAEGYTGN